MNSRFCLNILFHEFVLIRPGKKYIQVNKFLFFCCWGGEKKIGKKSCCILRRWKQRVDIHYVQTSMIFSDLKEQIHLK